MGRPKAGVDLAGHPLVSYPLAAARAAGLEAVVVAKPDSALPSLNVDVTVLREPARPAHPLCGIVCVLEHVTPGRAVVIVAVDLPFAPSALLAHLAAAAEPLIVPRAGGRMHPLLARYHPSLLDRLTAALAGGDSLQATVARLGARTLEPPELSAFGDPGRMLRNINSSEDLAAAERELAQPSSGCGESASP